MSPGFLTLMAEYCPEDQQRIHAWYTALREAGFTGTKALGLPFHISLATFPVEEEASALALTRRLAERFAPLEVDFSHVGVFPGGQVLFAAPDMEPAITALQAACDCPLLNGHPWTPHTTLLMDEPEVVGQALPVLMRHFTPIRARIDRLQLGFFWPSREILTLPLTGKE